ncbi:MAG: hypothetical protein WBI74_01450 [Caldicoprobacterales bacterium]|jgi:hypothetical protein|nr:hypothetical protein [Clostridiales bacterium]
MEKIERHVQELKKQVKEIQINPSNHGNVEILRIIEQLDKIISEFIRELNYKS